MHDQLAIPSKDFCLRFQIEGIEFICVVLLSFLLCFVLFIIRNGGVSFRSGNDGFICWRTTSPLNPNNSSWVSSRVLRVSCASLGMVLTRLACIGYRFWLCFLFFFVFLLSLFTTDSARTDTLQHRCISLSSSSSSSSSS